MVGVLDTASQIRQLLTRIERFGRDLSQFRADPVDEDTTC